MTEKRNIRGEFHERVTAAVAACPAGALHEEEIMVAFDSALSQIAEEVEAAINQLDANAGHDEAWYTAIKTVRTHTLSITKQ